MTDLVKSVDEEFERCNKYPNAMNFSDVQLTRREADLKIIKERYPTVPPAWAEMAWNYCETTPQAVQDEIINKGLWDKPPKERATGGVLRDAVVVEHAPKPPPNNTNDPSDPSDPIDSSNSSLA